MHIDQKNWHYLQESYQRGRLSHAYLFCGPQGTGTFEAAIQFAALVNQLEMEPEKIANGQHPDVLVVQPEVEEKKGKRRMKDISIEQVKKIMEQVSYYAYQSAYKVLIIDRADKLTVSAANSLLKLIEEPSSDTIVILTTYNEEAVLPTIRSRCQRLRFGLQPTDALVTYLTMHHPERPQEEIQQAAEHARGRVMVAQEYLTDHERLTEITNAVEAFRSALRQGVGKGFALVESVVQDKAKLMEYLEEWLWYLNRLQIKMVKDKADIRMQKKILSIIKNLLEVKLVLEKTNANEKLQLEHFFVNL